MPTSLSPPSTKTAEYTTPFLNPEGNWPSPPYIFSGLNSQLSPMSVLSWLGGRVGGHLPQSAFAFLLPRQLQIFFLFSAFPPSLPSMVAWCVRKSHGLGWCANEGHTHTHFVRMRIPNTKTLEWPLSMGIASLGPLFSRQGLKPEVSLGIPGCSSKNKNRAECVGFSVSSLSTGISSGN